MFVFFLNYLLRNILLFNYFVFEKLNFKLVINSHYSTLMDNLYIE